MLQRLPAIAEAMQHTLTTDHAQKHLHTTHGALPYVAVVHSKQFSTHMATQLSKLLLHMLAQLCRRSCHIKTSCCTASC
jgi:hypothetical protein